MVPGNVLVTFCRVKWTWHLSADPAESELSPSILVVTRMVLPFYCDVVSHSDGTRWGREGSGSLRFVSREVQL